MIELNQIYCMDVFDFLRQLPDDNIHCCITSPPYFRLRKYGMEGELGSESTYIEYIERMVAVFHEVKRVLRKDGNLWLNIGDSYAGSGKGPSKSELQHSNPGALTGRNPKQPGMKNKDLMMIPARLVIALHEDGWYVRSEIAWKKLNPLPESVKDRPSRGHEMVYLLSKSPKYWFDIDAIREPVAENTIGRGPVDFGGEKGRNYNPEADDPNYRSGSEQWGRTYNWRESSLLGRQKRTVWEVANEGLSEDHHAAFPSGLIEPMVLAGCPRYTCPECGKGYKRITERTFVPQKDVSPERSIKGANGQKPMYEENQWEGFPRGTTLIKSLGWQPSCNCGSIGTAPGIVLDPFMGSGTTALVAQQLGRDYLGCDLNPEYVQMAEMRIVGRLEEYSARKKAKPFTVPMFE